MDPKIKEIFLKHFKTEENLFSYQFKVPKGWEGFGTQSIWNRNNVKIIYSICLPKTLPCLKKYIIEIIKQYCIPKSGWTSWTNVHHPKYNSIYLFMLELGKHQRTCGVCCSKYPKVFYEQIDKFVVPNLMLDQILTLLDNYNKIENIMYYDMNLFKKLVLTISFTEHEKSKLLYNFLHKNYNIFCLLFDNNFDNKGDLLCRIIMNLGTPKTTTKEYYKYLNKYLNKKDITDDGQFDNYKIDFKQIPNLLILRR